MSLLIRFSKRRTSWESTDASFICKSEFKDRNGNYDLRPSVYEIDDQEIVRTYAEHIAAIPIDPERGNGCSAVDFFLGSSVKVEQTVGMKDFQLIFRQHRELVFSDKDEIETVISTIVDEIEARHWKVSKSDVQNYARERLSAEDEEWIAVVEKNKTKKRWLRKLAEDF